MTKIKVATVSELDSGDCRIIETDEGEIGVFNANGEYYAIKNECPHRGGPVCEGKVQNTLVGEWEGPSTRAERSFGDDPAITCPWHGWDFNLASGEHVGYDAIKLPTYDVVISNEEIYIEI